MNLRFLGGRDAWVLGRCGKKIKNPATDVFNWRSA